ncbi:hypothetical protein NDU88_006488 [Pleurodeles waltl]|uniref:Uncharacterized protein n=1 Tax=Pleurodeles waltl TaxID=8319 RepID=A0AAV7TXT0_PLEWA|nr:hypothetical protein NDU88_006488 [Pleurodeles waltl]
MGASCGWEDVESTGSTEQSWVSPGSGLQMPADMERAKTLQEASGGAQQESEERKSEEVERQEGDKESEDRVLKKRRQEEIRRKEEKEDEQRKGQELKGSPEIPDLPGEDPKDWTYCDTSRHVPVRMWLSQGITPTGPRRPNT